MGGARTRTLAGAVRAQDEAVTGDFVREQRWALFWSGVNAGLRWANAELLIGRSWQLRLTRRSRQSGGNL